MTINVYNNKSDLPGGTGPQPGDEAFVKSTNGFYRYEDMSQITSYSYGFDSNSQLLVDKSVTNNFDSNTRFTQQFWFFSEDQTGSPIFSYNIDQPPQSQSVLDIGPNGVIITKSTTAENPVIQRTPFRYHPNFVDSPFSGSLKLSTDYQYTIDSAGKGFIDATDTEDSHKSTNPWTLQKFIYRRSLTSPYTYNDDVDIASTKDGNFRLTNKTAFYNGVHYKFKTNETDTFSSTQNTEVITDDNAFTASSVVYDGYHLAAFRDKTRIHAIPSPSNAKAAGGLNIKEFDLEMDASFSAKVYFPTSVSGDMMLFTLGNGTGNSTEIKYVHNTTSFDIKCRQLSTSIDISSYFTGAWRVVHWDVRINPGRIRVWIDDNCIANVSTINPLTGSKWAQRAFNITGSALKNLRVTALNHNSTGASHQPAWYGSAGGQPPAYPGSGASPTPDPASLRVSDGNVFYNITYNNANTYFYLTDQLLRSNSYYFEVQNNTRTSGNYYTGYISFRAYLVHGDWDGTYSAETGQPMGYAGSSSQYIPLYQMGEHGDGLGVNFWQWDKWSSYDGLNTNPPTVTPTTIFTNARNNNGVYSFVLPYGSSIANTVSSSYGSYLPNTGDVISYFIDAYRGACFALYNGTFAMSPIYTNVINNRGYYPAHQFQTGNTVDQNMKGEGFIPSYNLKNGNGNFKLVIQTWWQNRYYNHFNAYTTLVNNKFRIMERDPLSEVEYKFNPDTWKYDPVELLQNKIKPQFDNAGTHVGGKGISSYGTDMTYPLTGIPGSGNFLSGDNVDDWFLHTGGDYYPLKYSPQLFKSFSQSPLKFGNAEVDINEDNELGSDHAAAYVARTGGSIVNATATNDLHLTIASMIDGDALVLAAGNYKIRADLANYYNVRRYHSWHNVSSIFLGKKILICGATDNPEDVVIDYIPYYRVRDRDVYAIFDELSDRNTEVAFCTVKRDLSGAEVITSYEHEDMGLIHESSKGGTSYKVIYDFRAANPSGINGYGYGANGKRMKLAYDRNDDEKVFDRKRRFINVHFLLDDDGYIFDYYAPPSTFTMHNTAWNVGLTNNLGGGTDRINGTKEIFTGYYITDADFGSNPRTAKATTTPDFIIHRPHLQKRKEHDSIEVAAFTDPLLDVFTKQNTTPSIDNRSMFIESKTPKKELLKINDVGQVFKSSTLGKTHQVHDLAIPADTWVHVVLTWNPATNTVQIGKDGTLQHTETNFFDSYMIKDTRLSIGSEESATTFDNGIRYAGLGEWFQPRFLSAGGNVKDFELSDSNFPFPYSVPTSELIAGSKTKLLTANDNAPTGTVSLISGTAKGYLLSPFLSGTKDWFQYGVATGRYTDVTTTNTQFSSVSGNVYQNSHHNNTEYAKNEEVYSFDYPFEITDGAVDSPDLQAHLVFSNVDANGDSISWTYTEDNLPRRVIVSHDASGYNYYLRKYPRSFLNGINYTDSSPGFEKNVLLRFKPRLVNTDSYRPKAFAFPNQSHKQDLGDIIVNFHRLKTSIDASSLPGKEFFAAFVHMKEVDKDSIDVLSAIHDSYPKLSFYTPTGDSTHGSIVLQDNALIKYDSIGALP